ncbi:nuclease (SNase-like) [Trichormus variabilis ATCC 29413]|uniref:Nuclease (SNase-like) n=2 Tax=Anabaena variabilis TaxID=264691 RepID=Q3MGX5_TRIV2|nr:MULTISPECIES: thermonuclease family protein [Nostocaceae]ABA19761.1 nuclease (SNase-like) [Trichormus variabilis ATCC 29413]MBC1214753.1 thermonuclease family protein [Trichormus variabilis ARAD]MBC1254493.1 thermonuclease family protein [Trichormus variabilis V5]MBC1267035.1 thermonuclease family protein [Trichormus variabilis FSR]MBC1303519.1 thermonuclease family protein [Trichormus variabilis N2B]
MALLELILLLATIVGVVDGKTITVKNDTGQTATVRLACIDIPKTAKQKYHLAAKQKLQQLLPSRTPVVIRIIRPDSKDIAFGEVYVDNRSINLRLVAEGNAVVDQASLEVCEETKTQYLIAEANAKNKRLGLWQQLNPAITK